MDNTRYMCALWVPLRALPWPHVQRGVSVASAVRTLPQIMGSWPEAIRLAATHHLTNVKVSPFKCAPAHMRAPSHAAARPAGAPAATPHLGNVTSRSLRAALAAATRAPTSCQRVKTAPLAPQKQRTCACAAACVAACPHQRRLLCRREAHAPPHAHAHAASTRRRRPAPGRAVKQLYGRVQPHQRVRTAGPRARRSNQHSTHQPPRAASARSDG